MDDPSASVMRSAKLDIVGSMDMNDDFVPSNHLQTNKWSVFHRYVELSDGIYASAYANLRDRRDIALFFAVQKAVCLSAFGSGVAVSLGWPCVMILGKFKSTTLSLPHYLSDYMVFLKMEKPLLSLSRLLLSWDISPRSARVQTHNRRAAAFAVFRGDTILTC